MFKCLLGRNVWALRLPTAFVGIATVEWCFRFERFLGRRTSAWAAVAMLVSPGTLYFQRDAIHEAWLLFFLVLGFWGVCGLCQEGGRRHLWATGLALAGMILTKETYIIHLGCLGLAGGCTFLAELLQPSRRTFLRPEAEPPHAPPRPDTAAAEGESAPRPGWITLPEDAGLLGRVRDAFPSQQWNALDLLAVAGTILALIVFFYSGNFFHWQGLEGLVTAYSDTRWGKKADDGEGHAKPFFTWCQQIVRNEPWALLGLGAAVACAVPGMPRAWRRPRGMAVAAAALCVAGVVVANAWDPVLGNTWDPVLAKAVRPLSVLRADHAWWWAAGGLIAAAGVACAALPPPAGGLLRLCGGLAAAGCVAALCLPRVYPEPHLFTVVLLGLAAATASLALPAPGDWRVRLLAIYGIGTLAAYSIIRYKTPWCIISLLWPFFFTGGAALAELSAAGTAAGREMGTVLGAAAAAVAAMFAVDLSYFRPTDDDFHQRPGENLSYVYVQSFDDVWTVTDFLLDEAAADRTFLDHKGVILCDSTYPLPWLLGDFRDIGYYSGVNAPGAIDDYRVDFLLVSDKRTEEVESKLDDTYYKQPIRLRPALEELQLYLRASRFAHLMPADRQPEFHPVPEAPAAPANPDLGVAVPMPPGAGQTSPASPAAAGEKGGE